MKHFLKQVHSSAKKDPKRIVYSEGDETRTLTAIQEILAKGIAHPILIGDPRKIKTKAKNLKRR